jgi:NitT/TauT family transport system substrate-binding protein
MGKFHELTRRMPGASKVAVCCVVAAGAVGVGAGCGGSEKSADAGGAAGGGAQEKEVSFRFDVTASGYVAPFLLADEKGWYRDAGLKVTFGEGSGSSATIQLVANGKDTFGWSDFGTMMGLVGEGAPVKAVAIVGQQSPVGIIGMADGPIQSPQDLEGHRLLVNPRGASGQLFKAVAEAQNLDVDKIQLVNTTADVSNATLLARKRVDAFVGWETFELPAVKELKIDPLVLPFRDFGVNPMNVSIVASNDTIANDPDTVKAFVTASMKAWEYTIDNPDEALDVLVARYPNIKRSIAAGQLAAQIPLLHTPRSEGKSVGWAATEDVAETQQVLLDTKLLTEKKDPADYYTSEFVGE